MGVITTRSKFCYIECDRSRCTRKIYHFHEKILKQLAVFHGWEVRGDRWSCPECAEKSRSRKKQAAKPERKTAAYV